MVIAIIAHDGKKAEMVQFLNEQAHIIHKNQIELISTGTTGGLANPIISLLEAVASILCILISLFLVAIIPIVIIFLIWKSIGYIQITKKEVVV